VFGPMMGSAALELVRVSHAQGPRLLRPGGRFVLHVHNRWFNLWDPQGRRWLLGNTLAALLGRAAAGASSPGPGDLSPPWSPPCPRSPALRRHQNCVWPWLTASRLT